MNSRTQRIRLGVFLAIAGTVLIGTLGLLSGARLLDKRTRYVVHFTDASISGLELGADVRYQGVRVGRVDKIGIDPTDLTTVVVVLELTPDTPIREDTEAILALQGITGLKRVELRAGTPDSPPLEPGGTIRPATAFVDEVGARAELLADRLEQVLNGLNLLLSPSNLEHVSGSLRGAEDAADSLSSLVGEVRQATTTLDRLMHRAESIFISDDAKDIVENLASVSAQIEGANVDSLAWVAANAFREAERAFTHMDLIVVQSREDLLRSAESLREAADNMNEFTRLISENPARILRGSSPEEIDAPWSLEVPQ